MSRVRLSQLFSKSSGFATHKKVNLMPSDVYPVVGAVTMGCLMSVGIVIHTATKPNSGVNWKGNSIRKTVTKTINEIDNKLKKYFIIVYEPF